MQNYITPSARAFLFDQAKQADSLQAFQENLKRFNIYASFVEADTRLHLKVSSTSKSLPYRSLHFTLWDMELESPNAAPVIGRCIYKGVDALVKTVPLKNLNYQDAAFYLCDDGPMMVVYHDPKDGVLKVATGGNHDAEGKTWLSSLDFKELFESCAGYLGLDLATLDKDVSYTFLVIHPDNRCVAPVEKRRLVLVGTCRVHGEGEVAPLVNVEVQTPMDETFADREAVLTRVRNLPWHVPGILIRTVMPNSDEVGRVYVSNPAYNKVHKLKGNSRNMKAQMYHLIKTNQHEEFLTYFPEYTSLEVDVQAKLKHLAYVLFGLYFRKAGCQEHLRSKLEELLYHLDGVEKGLKKKGKCMKFGTVWWKVKQYNPRYMLPFLEDEEIFAD